MRKDWLIIKVSTLAFAIPSATQAQFSISRFTIDGGGGTSQGGGFDVAGTIGQPDAGLLSGGGFELQGGFWVGSPRSSPATFTPTPTGTLPTATPTPTGPMGTATRTPTGAPVQSGLDVRPTPLDQFIDALDMIEWVSRVKNSGATPEVFFDLSNHWIRNYL